MSALLSLPHAPRRRLSHTRQVPAALRARAARQIRSALAAGRLTASRLDTALAGGDAGIAQLMQDHHVLRGQVTVQPDPEARARLDARTTTQLVDWARHLRAAGRLDEDALARVTPENASSELIRLCAAGIAPRSAPIWQAEHPSLPLRYYAVGTSFTERLGSMYANAPEDSESLSIWLEPVCIPMLDLPRLDDASDQQALLSAVHALALADHFGLWVSPAHVPWVLDSWVVEMILDLGIEAAKDAHGRPIFTAEHCERLAEEIGLEVDDDTCSLLADHYAYLRGVEAASYWKPDSQQMRGWLRRRAGSDLHTLVARLLELASALDAQVKDESIEIEAWAHFELLRGFSVSAGVSGPSLTFSRNSADPSSGAPPPFGMARERRGQHFLPSSCPDPNRA